MRYLKAIRLQLIVFTIIIIFYILVNLEILPDEGTLLLRLNKLFEEKGIIILFLLSLFENIVGVNIYFPGSIPIVYGMSRTSGNPELAFKTFTAIFAAVLIGNLVNTIIGKITSYGADKKQNLSIRTYILTLWHPHLSSLTSLHIGETTNAISNFVKYFIPVAAVWYVIGGIFIYTVGFKISESFPILLSIFYLYLIIWIILDLKKEYDQSKSSSKIS